MSKPIYLGDGLYCEYDGNMYRLFASNGMETTNEVFLDHTTLAEFLRVVYQNEPATTENDRD